MTAFEILVAQLKHYSFRIIYSNPSLFVLWNPSFVISTELVVSKHIYALSTRSFTPGKIFLCMREHRHCRIHSQWTLTFVPSPSRNTTRALIDPIGSPRSSIFLLVDANCSFARFHISPTPSPINYALFTIPLSINYTLIPLIWKPLKNVCGFNRKLFSFLHLPSGALTSVCTVKVFCSERWMMNVVRWSGGNDANHMKN